MRKEEEETLWEAFGSLPGRYQVLLRLLFADPAPTYQEISSVTGMPVGSIGPLFGDDALPSSVSVPRAQTGVRSDQSLSRLRAMTLHSPGPMVPRASCK